jgi:hypothetical protein
MIDSYNKKAGISSISMREFTVPVKIIAMVKMVPVMHAPATRLIGTISNPQRLIRVYGTRRMSIMITTLNIMHHFFLNSNTIAVPASTP